MHKKRNHIRINIACLIFLMLIGCLPMRIYAANATVTFGSESYEGESGGDFPVGIYIRGDTAISQYHISCLLLFHNKIRINLLLYSYTPFISNDYIISFLLSLLSYLHYIQTSPERFSLNPLILSLIMYCPKSMYRHTSKRFHLQL